MKGKAQSLLQWQWQMSTSLTKVVHHLINEKELSEQQTDTRHLHFVRRCVVGPFARKDPQSNSYAMIDSHDEEYISLNFRKYDPPLLHPLKNASQF